MIKPSVNRLILWQNKRAGLPGSKAFPGAIAQNIGGGKQVVTKRKVSV